MRSVIQKKSFNSVKVFYLDKKLLKKKIKEGIKKIIRECKEVEKIVIFGSFAKNRMTVSSDIDILIIVNSCSEKFLDRALKYKKYFNIGIDVDIFVYTIEEIKNGIPLVETALREGIIIFEKNNSNLTSDNSQDTKLTKSFLSKF